MTSTPLVHSLVLFLAAAPVGSYRTPELETRLSTTEISVVELKGNLYAFFGVGGNIVASIGEQGVLLVDDQFPEMAPRYEAAIVELGGDGIDFAINTHWHYDHADGNLALGPAGTWLVSQFLSRRMMQADNVIDSVNEMVAQKAYPDDALPVLTFDDRMQFHFNGEQIDLVHFGAAHTAGDAAVIFRSSGVAHLGDVYNAAGYPFIDLGNGGDFDGLIRFCEAVLAEIDADTVVVPGHGTIGGYRDLEAYIAMLKTIRGRIAELIDDGASLDEVIAANVTAEWDEQRGNPLRLIDRAYWSLKRSLSGQ